MPARPSIGTVAEAERQKSEHLPAGIEILLGASGLRGSQVPVFVLDHVKHADAIDCAINDEKARIVYLSGAPLRIFAPSGQSAGSSHSASRPRSIRSSWSMSSQDIRRRFSSGRRQRTRPMRLSR